METVYLQKETVLQNRYRIRKLLGVGGFGITYLAHDESLGQYVVIKEYYPQEIAGREHGTGQQAVILPKDRKDRRHYLKGKKDFLTEARRMSQLSDIPEVVKVLDWFEEKQTAYLVMEYVRGMSLDWYLQRQEVPLSFRGAWEMLSPVAKAMEKVHRKGMIHRDLNPGNIMICEDRSIKVIDFGAARSYLDTEKTKTILIKKGYAPPEQYFQKGKQGPWTDVYAFCATLYEMITGVRPEPSIERMQKDLLYLPSAYGSEILPWEEIILCRGLELNIRKRIKSMKELQELMGEETEKRQEKQRGFLKISGISMLTGMCAAAVAAAFFLGMVKEEDRETYAGNYARQSERYREYITFVEKHAVSSSEEKAPEAAAYQGSSTIYTLSLEAVKTWGEPCNRVRFNRTKDEFLDFMEAKGHSLSKRKTSEKDTVEIFRYGAVITSFCREESYETEDGVRLRLLMDSVNEDLFRIGFAAGETMDQDMENAMVETARFLADPEFFSAKTAREEIRELTERTPDEGSMSTGQDYCLSVSEQGNEWEWLFTNRKESAGYLEYYWE